MAKVPCSVQTAQEWKSQYTYLISWSFPTEITLELTYQCLLCKISNDLMILSSGEAEGKNRWSFPSWHKLLFLVWLCGATPINAIPGSVLRDLSGGTWGTIYGDGDPSLITCAFSQISWHELPKWNSVKKILEFGRVCEQKNKNNIRNSFG